MDGKACEKHWRVCRRALYEMPGDFFVQGGKVIQRIATGHGVGGPELLWKLRSMFRGGPRTARFAACVSVGLALGACSSTNGKPLVRMEEKIMSSPNATAAPRLDAPEVLRRFLALIDTVHQPQDLTAERVAQFIGFAMEPYSDKPTNDTYVISQPVTEMWRVRIGWGPQHTTRLPSVGLGFHKLEKYANQDAPMTGICQLDAVQVHEELLKLGYRHVGNARNGGAAKQYQRGLVKVEIGIFGESGESLEKISHGCVHRVYVSFLEKYMDLGATW